MPSLNPALIPGDFLLEEGRVIRPPLLTWAHSLMARLESGEAAPGQWLNVSGCLNNASLIEVYRGRLAGAQEYCELQLRCAENLVRFHDPRAYAEFVVQPWVNLGRLHRIQKRFELAQEYFAMYFEALLGASPRLWPLQFEASHWKSHAEAQSLLPFVRAVYIVDSTKAFWAKRDLEGAVGFLREARQRPQCEGSLLLDEAELLTLFKMGRHDGAMAITEEPAWQQQGAYGKLLRVTYRVGLLAASGAVEPARQLATQLAERVLAGDWSSPKDQRVLRYLHYLGQLLWELGSSELAARVWRTGLLGASKLEDVPLHLMLLESLLELPALPDREGLEVERRALLRESLYVALLSSRGMTAEPERLLSPIFDQLRQRLESIARASALAAPTSAIIVPEPLREAS